MSDHILSIDVGTTNLVVLLLSLSEGTSSFVKRRIKSEFPQFGRVEQDAGAIWISLIEAIDELLGSANLTPEDIAAIGVTTQRSSIVIWDSRFGEPLAPMIVWSDLRGVDRAQELNAMGFAFVPQHAATKLEIALSSVADRVDSHTMWGNIDSYILWKLTGENLTDRSQAWASGYLDISTGDWNDNLIGLQSLSSSMFPKIVDTRGAVTKTNSKIFGAKVPVSAIVADQQCSIVAHGNLSPGARKMSYGTSGVYNLTIGNTPTFIGDEIGTLIQSHVSDETMYCVEGMILSVGAMFDWLVNTLKIAPSVNRLSDVARSANNNNGVAVLPALWGLGAPHGMSRVKARILGLSTEVDQASIVYAALQGVAFRVREMTEAIEESPNLPCTSQSLLPVDGGASQIDALLQIQADILQQPIKRPVVSETTAHGAALSAAMGVGAIKCSDLQSLIAYDAFFEPKVSRDEADAAFQTWKQAVYQGVL